MLKEDLKRMWGKYTDTDKLVDDIMELLTEYGHRNTEHGVCSLLDKFFEKKHPLIEGIIRSEHYAGNLRIVTTKEFEREISVGDVRNFCDSFLRLIDASKIILRKVDNSGKTVEDYALAGFKRLNAKNLLDEKWQNTVAEWNNEVNKIFTMFTEAGDTIESQEKLMQLTKILRYFRSILSPTLDDAAAAKLNSICADLKVASGMKTSRAFNRACVLFGIDKSKKYNGLFQPYADMVSSKKRQLDFVISVNPYDYLTMSFGNSWASCHTIDKNNVRRMPNDYSGAYCGGTISYMLDSVSIITYVVGNGADVQKSGKIYRNMFHYSGYALIQGRVYPQGNDGCTDLYKTFRLFMQEAISPLIGLNENKWTKSGRSVGDYVADSFGVHYRDYFHYSSCNVSYPSEKKAEVNAREMIIGSWGICPYCGKAFSENNRLSHPMCQLD